MVFVKYDYAGQKQKVKDLVRKRLKYKDKVRYHHKKIEEMENNIIEIEKEIDKFLDSTK